MLPPARCWMLEAHTEQMDNRIGIIFMVRSSSMECGEEWVLQLTWECIWGRFFLLLQRGDPRVVGALG